MHHHSLPTNEFRAQSTKVQHIHAALGTLHQYKHLVIINSINALSIYVTIYSPFFLFCWKYSPFSIIYLRLWWQPHKCIGQSKSKQNLVSPFLMSLFISISLALSNRYLLKKLKQLKNEVLKEASNYLSVTGCLSDLPIFQPQHTHQINNFMSKTEWWKKIRKNHYN